MNHDSAIEKAMNAYSRAANRDLAQNGICWDIIPEGRWDAFEAPEGWIVSGYSDVLSMRNGDPVTRWLVREDACRQINLAAVG